MIPLNLYYVNKWLESFALTQAVEVWIYAYALWRFRLPLAQTGESNTDLATSRRLSTWQIWVLAFGPSALTHPIVWFGFPWFAWNYWLVYGLAEGFAVLVEAVYLKMVGMSLQQAIFWSLVANASSVAVSEILRRGFGLMT